MKCLPMHLAITNEGIFYKVHNAKGLIIVLECIIIHKILSQFHTQKCWECKLFIIRII